MNSIKGSIGIYMTLFESWEGIQMLSELEGGLTVI